MLAMSNRNIVLFSTRKIMQEGIFSFFDQKTESPSLQTFFYEEGKDALDRIKQMSTMSSNQGNNEVMERYGSWKERLVEFIKGKTIPHLTYDLKDSKNARLVVRTVKEYLLNHQTDGLNEFLKETSDLYDALPKDLSSSYPSFAETDWNNGDIKALEWEKDGMTLSDRVSLFYPSDNNGEYGVYAVHQLSRASTQAKWVDALKNAIQKIENLDLSSSTILLWLHEKDLIETKGDAFRVLDLKDTGYSLGVFSHADTVFQDVLHLQCNVTDLPELVFKKVHSLFLEKGSMAITKMIECDKKEYLSDQYDALNV